MHLNTPAHTPPHHSNFRPIVPLHLVQSLPVYSCRLRYDFPQLSSKTSRFRLFFPNLPTCKFQYRLSPPDPFSCWSSTYQIYGPSTDRYAYSFIIRLSIDVAFDIYWLVYLAMREWLRKEKALAEWIEKAVVYLDNIFPDNDYRNRIIWRRYLTYTCYTDKEEGAWCRASLYTN